MEESHGFGEIDKKPLTRDEQKRVWYAMEDYEYSTTSGELANVIAAALVAVEAFPCAYDGIWELLASLRRLAETADA